MTFDQTGAAYGMTPLEQAKAEILGPEQLYAPAPLVNLANSQLVPIIREMEALLVNAATHIDNAAFIHLKYVRFDYVDESAQAMEEVLESRFFSTACERFVNYYERKLNERGFTTPSPA